MWMKRINRGGFFYLVHNSSSHVYWALLLCYVTRCWISRTSIISWWAIGRCSACSLSRCGFGQERVPCQVATANVNDATIIVRKINLVFAIISEVLQNIFYKESCIKILKIESMRWIFDVLNLLYILNTSTVCIH